MNPIDNFTDVKQGNCFIFGSLISGCDLMCTCINVTGPHVKYKQTVCFVLATPLDSFSNSQIFFPQAIMMEVLKGPQSLYRTTICLAYGSLLSRFYAISDTIPDKYLKVHCPVSILFLHLKILKLQSTNSAQVKELSNENISVE